MIWCPKCHRFSTLKVFYKDTCPQCGTIATEEMVLHEDPFLKKRQERTKIKPEEKEFLFDQKDGTHSKSGKGSMSSVLTEQFGFYKKDSK